MNGTSQPVVLVTGAAGGLGTALVNEFIAQKWRVTAGYHSATWQSPGEQLWPVPLDVTQSGRAREVVKSILDRWGRIDALINNAGVTADQACWQLEDENWERVVQVNLKGAFLCAQAVLGPMIDQRAGHIINVASFSARAGQRGQSNYAAAKAGLLGLTEALAREAGMHNIRVNAVLPGVLPTPMTARLGADKLAEFASLNVLGRINTLEEVARFIVFLAGMENVSGQLFQLDSRIGRWA